MSGEKTIAFQQQQKTPKEMLKFDHHFDLQFTCHLNTSVWLYHTTTQ